MTMQDETNTLDYTISNLEYIRKTTLKGEYGDRYKDMVDQTISNTLMYLESLYTLHTQVEHIASGKAYKQLTVETIAKLGD